MPKHKLGQNGSAAEARKRTECGVEILSYRNKLSKHEGASGWEWGKWDGRRMARRSGTDLHFFNVISHFGSAQLERKFDWGIRLFGFCGSIIRLYLASVSFEMLKAVPPPPPFQFKNHILAAHPHFFSINFVQFFIPILFRDCHFGKIVKNWNQIY